MVIYFSSIGHIFRIVRENLYAYPVPFIPALQITRIMLISKHCHCFEGDARQTWLKRKSFLDRRDKPGNRHLYVSRVSVQCSISQAKEKKKEVGGERGRTLCITSYKRREGI